MAKRERLRIAARGSAENARESALQRALRIQDSANGATMRTRVIKNKKAYNRNLKHKKSFASAEDFAFSDIFFYIPLKGSFFMGAPVISFVIPVYNGERYIRETVERIFLAAAQNENIDFEVICVDDCCTDNSPAILDELSASYPAVRVIHKSKNENVGAARNDGIEAAKGEWICFVDSDDIVHSYAFDVFERLLDNVAEPLSENDIVYFLYDQFSSRAPKNEPRPPQLKKHIFAENEISEQQAEILTRRKIKGKPYNFRTLAYVWGKLYRRDFLNRNNIRFVESMRYEEDLSFNFMCLARCRRSMLVEFPLIHYRFHEASYTHGYVEGYWKRIVDTIPVYEGIVKDFYGGNALIAELFHYRVLWQLLFSELRGPCHSGNPKPYGERRREFLEILGLPEFRHVFSQVDISSLGFPNAFLAFGVKHRSLRFCEMLERVLQLKNYLVNLPR